ncbi:hypothetical protein FIU96_13140 [Marinobacter sp. THAF39]|nr:hypothetical protein FIV08_13230 [Marinobacter sp. THAF197a]QFT51574.1 hypothetical protein FIU96_13140 [Marinobacter sp. THAF39]
MADKFGSPIAQMSYSEGINTKSGSIEVFGVLLVRLLAPRKTSRYYTNYLIRPKF